MSEDLDALWEQSKPVAKPTDDLDALWEKSAPVHAQPRPEAEPQNALETIDNVALLGGAFPAAGAMRGGKALYDALMLGRKSDEAQSLDDMARGVRRGAAFDFTDELAGVIGAMRDDRTYEQARDSMRQEDFVAEQRNPVATGVGMAVGSGVVPVPAAKGMGAGKAAALIAGRALGEGAAYGLGSSDAEDAEGIAKDVGEGVLWAVPGAALGAGAQAFRNPALSRASKGIAEAQEEIDLKAAKSAAQIQANLTGTQGLAGDAKRAHTAMREMRELIREGLATPEEIAEYRRFIATDEGQQVLRSLARNSLDDLAESPQKIRTSTEALEMFDREAEFQRLQNLYGERPFSRTGRAFLSRYGSQVIPPLAGAVLGAVGGPSDSLTTNMIGGAAVGAVGGAGRSALYSRQRPSGANVPLGRAAQEILGEADTAAERLRAAAVAKTRNAFGDVGGTDPQGFSPGSAVMGALSGMGGEIVNEAAGAGVRPALRAYQRFGNAPDVRKWGWRQAGDAVDAAVGASSAAGFGGAAGQDAKQRRDTFTQTKEALRANPAAFGRFAAPLLEAEQRGENAFAAAFFVLSQQEPEFRAMLETKAP